MFLRTLLFTTAMLPVAALASEPAPLKQGVTSLGAAAVDGTLYIYGGYQGAPHHYSMEGQSDRFLSLNMEKPTEWKTLPSGPKIQSLELVAHDGKLYRLGGFQALNKQGEDSNLQSLADVAVYNSAEKSWKTLTDLPEPRSSFDAVVMGDRVYVVGGWTLGGGQGSGKWLKTAWSADLTQRPLVWEPLAEPPFQRRAVAVAAYSGEIYAIGGMADGETTRRVDIYNPKSDKWRRGPDLNGEKDIHGFGAAAVGTDTGLYVSSLSGTVQRLTEGAEQWEVVADLDSPRFFHQMIAHDGKLWLVGGANMVEGKLPNVEVIELKGDAAATAATAR